ncbi:MAG: hypothetical protein ABSE99_03915 [Terracidiphilus sp.]|jgi:hypothetical protein
MMTIENRTTIEAKDVSAIEVRCKCGSSVTTPLGRLNSEPSECPTCGASWSQFHEDLKKLTDLASLLRSLGSEQAQALPFSLRFVIASGGQQ